MDFESTIVEATDASQNKTLKGTGNIKKIYDGKQYLYSIIKPLVAFPDFIIIDDKTDDRGILLSINLHKDDMGRIIGKHGDTIRGIRNIIRQYGANYQQRIALKVNEPTDEN